MLLLIATTAAALELTETSFDVLLRKVPVALVDLAARPAERARMESYCAPEATLPQALVGAASGHGRAIGMVELQELEDAGELDPLLRAAVQQYADEMG